MAASYCFKCQMCGRKEQTNGAFPLCTGPYDDHSFGEHMPQDMIRDYKAEDVGLGSGTRVSRDGTNLEQARLFLPGNDEFVGPGDPDGKKGAREWLDNHQPMVTGGNNPLLDIERRSF